MTIKVLKQDWFQDLLEGHYGHNGSYGYYGNHGNYWCLPSVSVEYCLEY